MGIQGSQGSNRPIYSLPRRPTGAFLSSEATIFDAYDGLSLESLTDYQQGGTFSGIVNQYITNIIGSGGGTGTGIANLTIAGSITALRALSINSGYTVLLAGYYAAGDGGGQALTYKSTGRASITSPLNGPFYYSGGGASDYYEAVDKSVARVKTAGAVGDGVSNDTASINNCITAVNDISARRGGTVFFDKGVYSVSNITASGCSAIKFVGAGGYGGNAVLTANAVGAVLYLNNTENCVVENLDINGNSLATTGIYVNWDGASNYNSLNNSFQHLRIFNCSDGVHLKSTAAETAFRRVYVYQNTNGIVLRDINTLDISFDACRFFANQIGVSGGSAAGGVTFTNRCLFAANSVVDVKVTDVSLAGWSFYDCWTEQSPQFLDFSATGGVTPDTAGTNPLLVQRCLINSPAPGNQVPSIKYLQGGPVELRGNIFQTSSQTGKPVQILMGGQDGGIGSVVSDGNYYMHTIGQPISGVDNGAANASYRDVCIGDNGVRVPYNKLLLTRTQVSGNGDYIVRTEGTSVPVPGANTYGVFVNLSQGTGGVAGGTLVGVNSLINCSNTNIPASMYSINLAQNLSVAGTVAEFIGILTGPSVTAASASVTNLYHLKVRDVFVSNGGGVNNQYGVKIENLTGGNVSNYSIHAGSGIAHFGDRVEISGTITIDKTITTPGTTGAQTINKILGAVNFGSGASSLVVTNSKVNTGSLIFCQIATTGTNGANPVPTAANGSFTITLGTAPNAETKVNFMVYN